MEFAARRFAENGYHPTSVAEIVDELEVGKGVFYWYFSSKEELFNEILRDSQYALRRRQQHLIGTETDPVRRIELGMHATMNYLAENRHIFNLFQFAATEKAFAATLRQGAEVGAADTMRHVKEGMGEGRFADGDPWIVTWRSLASPTSWPGGASTPATIRPARWPTRRCSSVFAACSGRAIAPSLVRSARAGRSTQSASARIGGTGGRFRSAGDVAMPHDVFAPSNQLPQSDSDRTRADPEGP